MSGFSNYGTCIDVWAPGSGVESTYHLGDTSIATLSGTSMACPHVSGLAAIAYESNPTAESMSAADRWDLVSAKNATNEVTGLPTSPESDNLIFLSPFIDPTPAPPPTPAPTDAPTTTTTPGGALAVGDPHLQNLRGERFDLMKTGKHVPPPRRRRRRRAGPLPPAPTDAPT